MQLLQHQTQQHRRISQHKLGRIFFFFSNSKIKLLQVMLI